MRIKTPICTAIALIALHGLAASAHAQSTFAFQGIYASNGGENGPFAAVLGSGGHNNAGNPFTGVASFDGFDSKGVMQTVSVSGTAFSWASFGKIHAYGAGTITNPFYNPNLNPDYVNPDYSVNLLGAPDTLSVHGNAGWSDKFTYTGFSGSGYKVNYYFKLDGITSGDSAAGLNFSTNAPGSVSYNPRTHGSSALWITPWYDVVWGQEFEVNVDFFGGTTADFRNRPEGVTFSGVGDYSSTLTLAGIDVVDATGNSVTGWSLDSASGTRYPLGVPEPSSVLLLGSLVVVGVVKFRSRFGQVG